MSDGRALREQDYDAVPKILSKMFLIFILIAALLATLFYYEVSLRKRIINDLSRDQSEKIFEIIGLEEHDDLDILTFETLVHADVSYNLLTFSKKDCSALVDSDIADNCKQISKVNYFNKNSELFPRKTTYCALFYDEDTVYLSFRNNAYGKGAELMDYFYEIWKN